MSEQGIRMLQIDGQLVVNIINYIASCPSGNHPAGVPVSLIDALRKLQPVPEPKAAEPPAEPPTPPPPAEPNGKAAEA